MVNSLLAISSLSSLLKMSLYTYWISVSLWSRPNHKKPLGGDRTLLSLQTETDKACTDSKQDPKEWLSDRSRLTKYSFQGEH